ncbi:MAG: class I SAM-dependent methyltransferase [Candidatus Fermentibacteraceae bacterium]
MGEINAWDQVWKDFPTGGPLHGLGEFLSRRAELKRLVVTEVFRGARVPPDGTVLEAGCGTGSVMGLLAERGFRVVGVDLSPAALVHAASHSRELSVATVTSLPFANGAFDLVYSTGVFDLLDEQDLFSAVGEALRVTAPGGRIVLVTAAPCRLHRRVMGRLERKNRWRYGPKREIKSLSGIVLGHRPDALVREKGRGFALQLRFLVYLVEHRPLLRRLSHGLFMLVSMLLWPLNALPGMVLVTTVQLPKEA